MDRFQELAKKKGVTPSQYVLAWVLSQVRGGGGGGGEREGEGGREGGEEGKRRRE